MELLGKDGRGERDVVDLRSITVEWLRKTVGDPRSNRETEKERERERER